MTESFKSTPEQPKPNWSIEVLMSVTIPIHAESMEQACSFAWDEVIRRYNILDIEFGDIEQIDQLSTSTDQNES